MNVYPHANPNASWITTPEFRADSLVLFGKLAFQRYRLNGFDLVETNGNMSPYRGWIGNPGVSFGIAPHRVLLTNEFASVNPVPLNTHGVFWLRLRGETNVLAEVQLR